MILLCVVIVIAMIGQFMTLGTKDATNRQDKERGNVNEN